LLLPLDVKDLVNIQASLTPARTFFTMLHDKRHNAGTIGQTGDHTTPEDVSSVAEIVVGQTYMLKVLEVGESMRNGHDSSLLDEVVEVSGASEDKGCL
jgi:hypothetical protein